MRVIIQLRSSPVAIAAADARRHEPSLTASLSAAIPGLSIDSTFPTIQLPSAKSVTGGPLISMSQPLHVSLDPEVSTYLVRGTIPDEATTPMYATLLSNPEVVGLFADPVISTCPVCPGHAPVGTDADVARLLNVPLLQAAGMDGSNVFVAVVDTGINREHLQAKGRNPIIDVAKSFTPQGVLTAPGQHPVGHGTMCAYDVGIAAPNSQFLDDAVLLSQASGSTVMEGLLSDAVLAYSKLLQIIRSMPSSQRAMVVTNSWGMFSPTWDFPPGHPGNYSDNPNHPFNVIVASLENEGADILFAAGNCGRDCPDSRCEFGDSLPICGANSHPSIISVAGVDTTKARVGYSSQGPGRLTLQKPDLSGYTHFAGSGVFPADSGTSAACPVVAGMVAAIRSKCPSTVLSPLQLRALLFKTAQDRGKLGFDFDYGWGIVNPTQVLASLSTMGLIPSTVVAATVADVVSRQIQSILEQTNLAGAK
jgi:subtilisin family serine protease